MKQMILKKIDFSQQRIGLVLSLFAASVLAFSASTSAWARDPRARWIEELTRMLRGSERPYSQYIVDTRAFRVFSSGVLGREARSSRELRDLCGRLSLDELQGLHQRVRRIYDQAGMHIDPHMTLSALPTRLKSEIEQMADQHLGWVFARSVFQRLLVEPSLGIPAMSLQALRLLGGEGKALAVKSPSYANAFGAQAVPNRKFAQLASHSTRYPPGFIQAVYANERLTLWVRIEDLLTLWSGRLFVRASAGPGVSGAELAQSFEGVARLSDFLGVKTLPRATPSSAFASYPPARGVGLGELWDLPLRPLADQAGIPLSLPVQVRQLIADQYPELVSVTRGLYSPAEAELLLQRVEVLLGSDRVLLYAPNADGYASVLAQLRR